MTIKKEVKVGFFALLMIAGLYWGVNFLKGKDLLSSNNIYYATYEQVGGLQPSSAIMIKGFKIGTVSNISYDPTKTHNIVVELNIKSKYNIPENSKARIYSDGLMGGKLIEIELGNSTTSLKDRDTLRSEMDKGFLEVAGSEFDYFKKKANDIVGDLTVTLANINKLLEENTLYVGTTLSNLAAISGSLNDVVSSESQSLKSMIDNLNTFSKTLKDNSAKIDNTLTNIDGFTDSLKRSNIPLMVENLSSSLGQLDAALEKVNTGQGTLGKLVVDNGLYDSLTVASSNLSKLLEDVQKHPGKYLTISVFGPKNKSK